jgi:hypothetical protein
MPLARYFLYVGGVLLTLLCVMESYLPRSPAAGRASADAPVIRITSAHRWPERIVYDTSLPAIGPAQSTIAPVPPVTMETAIPPALIATPERDAFAQMSPSESFASAPPDKKLREAKMQGHHRTAKRYRTSVAQRMARQQQVFEFDRRSWWTGAPVWRF